MNKTILKVSHLYKKYGNLAAVNDVNFEVFEGEIFGLLGPNGAGKTTTLEIVETLRDETDGDVVIDGISVNKEPEKVKQIIGIQLQQSGFYPGLNLIELINLFADLYNEKVNPLEILKKVGLVDKAKSEFKKLSGGQKQRFSIATTLINHPKIIFLDEPTTGLDPQTRINLRELIKDIKRQGVTIVLTTHYMEEAETLCDRVAIMDNGKIVEIDTPDNLIKKLLKKGFKPEKKIRLATLEDVFLNLTGKTLRE